MSINACICSVLIDTTSEKLDGGHVGNYYRLQAKQLGEVLSSMPAQQRDSGLQVIWGPLLSETLLQPVLLLLLRKTSSEEL